MRAGRSRWFCAIGLAALLLGGCDEGSSPPATVEPGPTPSPSPSPSPSPTPSPTPTSATQIGQADIGQTFGGPMACASGTFDRSADGGNQLSAILALGAPKIDNRLDIAYPAADTYRLTTNGFDAASFIPADKKAGPTVIYDYFRQGVEEFELYRTGTNKNLFFATLGRYSDNNLLCFYAAGGPPAFVHPGSARFTGPFPFVGFADGISYAGGTTLRLLESSAQGDVNYVANTIAIKLVLRGRSPAFGEVAGKAVTSEETVTGTAQFGGGGGIVGTLSGSNGLSGTVTGQLFDSSPTGMTLVFQLSRPGGDVFYGAAALDAQL